MDTRIINDEGGGKWLAQQVESFELSLDTLATALDRPPSSTRERAFQALLLNRTNYGGIMAKGAGRMKGGEKGKGITSRWYPQTIARRIRDIAIIRHRLSFIQGDALSILPQLAHRQNMVTFIDPPYTAGGKRAGRRLYNYSELDHTALFQLVRHLRGDFLMTYDNAQAVKQLASQQQFETLPIAMKNTHHAKLTELLISRDLSWTRYYPSSGYISFGLLPRHHQPHFRKRGKPASGAKRPELWRRNRYAAKIRYRNMLENTVY